jgi:diacylglycerol kinase
MVTMVTGAVNSPVGRSTSFGTEWSVVARGAKSVASTARLRSVVVASVVTFVLLGVLVLAGMWT